ncbi:MAG: MFS transporter, partial [Dehalococcoidia bacterium]
DRFGARWSLVTAFVFIGSCLVLMAGITTLWQFYFLQVLGRMLTMGVVGLSMSIIIPKWFVAKRGRAVALGSLGARAGSTITPLYVQFLVSAGSWRLASATAGIMIWVISTLPAAIFLRRRPEDLGLLPDGATRQQSTPDQPVSSLDDLNEGTPHEVSLPLKQVVRLSSFYLLLVAFALVFMAFPSLHLHMISFLTDRGIQAEMAVIVLAVMSAAGAFGSLFFGFIAERAGSRLTMTIVFLFLSTAFPLLLTVHSLAPALGWGVYYGFLGGGVFTLQQLIFADYFGRESLGAIRGVVAPVQMGANAVGPLLAALAFDAAGDYVAIFIIYGVTTLIASLCIFLTRPPVLFANPTPGNSPKDSAGSSAS